MFCQNILSNCLIKMYHSTDTIKKTYIYIYFLAVNIFFEGGPKKKIEGGSKVFLFNLFLAV